MKKRHKPLKNQTYLRIAKALKRNTIKRLDETGLSGLAKARTLSKELANILCKTEEEKTQFLKECGAENE